MHRILITLIACSVLTGCTHIVPSLQVLGTASPSDFVGTWRGLAVDRPNEGTQRMTMTLVIHEPKSFGRWKATVGGDVVDNGEQEVTGLIVRGSKLAFRLPAGPRSTGPFWPMDIWLGLESESKDSLLGVGLPAPATGWAEREDSFSIRLTKDKE